MDRLTPPAIRDCDGTDIRHLISDADAGAWEFALGCGEWLTSDDGLTVCNQAWMTAILAKGVE
jgi:hypothetical protein